MKTFQQFLIESNLSNYLQQIRNSGYKLLAHQTDEDYAKSIIQSVFGSANGVAATSLWQTPDGVQEVLSRMLAVKHGEHSGNVVHRGSDSMVLMAIPSTIQNSRVKTPHDLDGWLFELNLNGKVPNENIIGYAKFDGTFVKNPNFNPVKSPLK